MFEYLLLHYHSVNGEYSRTAGVSYTRMSGHSGFSAYWQRDTGPLKRANHLHNYSQINTANSFYDWMPFLLCQSIECFKHLLVYKRKICL